MTAFHLEAMLRTPDNSNAQIRQIPVDMLTPYHDHKFQLYNGERLEDMVESIRTNGVLVPILVQPLHSGKYEILIGHNRWNASKLAGKPTVPAIVKEGLSEEEAEMYVVESNLMQRGFENLRISEQAEVLRMRHDKMFSQGKRNDIIRELQQLEGSVSDENTSAPVEKKLTTEIVGEAYGMSRNSVARLLRISKLNDTLKEWVDHKSVSIRAAVDISFLTESEQEMLCEIAIPTMLQMKTAELLKAYSKAGTLTKETMQQILSGTIQKQKGTPKPVKIPYVTYSRYFPDDTTSDEILETIQSALELYFQSDKAVCRKNE